MLHGVLGKVLGANLSAGGTIGGDLSITGDLDVSGDVAINLTSVVSNSTIIDATGTEAFLVRKDSDGGDVFVVDTTNSRVGIGGAPSSRLSISNASGSAVVALLVDQNNTSNKAFEIDSEQVSDYVFHINNPVITTGTAIGVVEANALTTGGIFYGISNSSSTSARSLFRVYNYNSSATGTAVANLSQRSTGSVLELDSYYTSGASAGAKMRLTTNDGGATGSGDRLGVIEFTGAEDSSNNLAIGATIEAFATEAWDATNNAAKMVISTTEADNTPVSIIEASTAIFKWMANGSNVNLSATTSGVQSGGYVVAGSNARLLNETSSATNPVITTGADLTDGIGGAAGTVSLITNSLSRLIVDDNSRISLSNNDGGGNNTVFGKLAGNALHATSVQSVMIGEEAGNALDHASVDKNVFIGYQVGKAASGGIITDKLNDN